MASARAVGIDLGTTYSAVASVEASGRSVMVRNREGDLLTPSVVYFGNAEVVVGKDARSATAAHPDRVAEWVKRDMGLRAYSRPIRGEYLPPEVIQACILKKLRDDIRDVLGPEANVVITVPAYFDEPRRKGTADAGEMAGLKVLDIVNEPTAAALAFGEIHGYLTPGGGARDPMTILVYDLGGGTFDVTLLRLAPGDIRTLATDGDVRLGGHEWDLRLVDRVGEAFKQMHGVDPREDPAALSRLFGAVVEAKHTLSARHRGTIQVDHAGCSRQIVVTRDEFEELTADLLERTAYTTRQLLSAAKTDWSQISRVLLVGGSTRMPMVSRMLQQMSGIAPDHTVNPDEAVARGAAIYANYLLAAGTAEGAGFQVTNVNSHSLGVEGIEPETLRKTHVVLIPRNTPLPAMFTEKFTTKRADQRSIVVRVLEGESSLPGECTAIGRSVIRDLPPGLPQGWPVEVTFEYEANGRLKVRAVVPGTQREVSLELQRDVGLSGEGISRWQRTVACSPGFDAFEAMVQEVLGLGGSAPIVPGEAPPGGAGREAEARSPGGGTQAGGAAPTSPDSPYPSHSSDPPQSPQTRSRPGATSSESPGTSDATLGYAPPAGDRAGGVEMVAGPQPLSQTWSADGTGAPGAEAGPPQAAGWAEYERAEPEPLDARRPPRIPPSLIKVLGFVVSAIVGLGLGYLLVSWLFPGSRLLP